MKIFDSAVSMTPLSWTFRVNDTAEIFILYNVHVKLKQ